jgi:NADH-quinone oxidoreductase subunit M
LLGAWQRYPGLTAVAASAIVLTAGYLLWTLQRVWLGTLDERYAGLAEINGRELATLLPLAAIVLVLGVYPHAVLDLINVSLLHLNDLVAAGAASSVAAR